MNYFVSLVIILHLFAVCLAQTCEKSFDEIAVRRVSSYDTYKKCWYIEVPQNSYVRINVKELDLQGRRGCSEAYLIIYVTKTGESYEYCSQDMNRKPITAFSDVNVTFYSAYDYHAYVSSFKLIFTVESLICALNDHFRCSSNLCIYPYEVCNGVNDCEDGADEVGCENSICAEIDHFRCSSSFCIHQYEVCNGVKDCEDGADEVGCEKGIIAVKGINTRRESVVNWLKEQKSSSFGWGKNTHRAITALYLAKAVNFTGENLEEELMAKQLELHTSVALLRNSTDPISVSELSMFVNALQVTCHNPRNFYGHDLLQILGQRASVADPPSPIAYLTLCNSNWTFTQSDFTRVFNFLKKPSEYPFISDVQAVAIMAISCMIKQTLHLRSTDRKSLYDGTIKKFVAAQLPDGSFGNVYTTALVTQALIASEQENNKEWNVTATAHYLMNQLNSSTVDFLATYYTLPIFNGKSLVDISAVNCSNITRKHGDDSNISDVTNKLGGKMSVQYSLYVGDKKDVIHTIILRMPENSTAYDVMRVAQVADPKYKFLHRDVSGQMYVFDIAGITNDPEAGKFWLLYLEDRDENETLTHYTQSPDALVLSEADHLIMWYKTASI